MTVAAIGAAILVYLYGRGVVKDLIRVVRVAQLAKTLTGRSGLRSLL
jgi:hypothetical protein